MKRAYSKYIAALLLFGSNGIVASHISLSSYEIVFTRTLIGSLFLILGGAAYGELAGQKQLKRGEFFNAVTFVI